MDHHFGALRERMMAEQLVARGIRDSRVLHAVAAIPRHAFVPAELAEAAYADSPLPIGHDQTISQPYIVGLMAKLAEIQPDDCVLDVGTGSGYGAAVLSKLGQTVYTVERHADLARQAEARFKSLQIENIHCRTGNGALGWSEAAPFDVIIVAAAGEWIPQPLLDQLAVGGRLIVPVGGLDDEHLLRVTRPSEKEYEYTDCGPVAFVPLVDSGPAVAERTKQTASKPLDADLRKKRTQDLRECVQPFDSPERYPFEGLLDRIGDARVVCIGEATHGTSEFYRLRASITRYLIEDAGFSFVAAEADWPDARHINAYIHGGESDWWETNSFVRFPTWMWRNEEVHEFAEWLRGHNRFQQPAAHTSFYGLDLYSMYASINAVIEYLEQRDPQLAKTAKARYECLLPWRLQPQLYGRLALTDPYRSCEKQAVAMLRELLQQRERLIADDGEEFMDVHFNAQIVVNAERYYRSMYYGSVESWNLRDQHMFDSLKLLLNAHGPESRAVVWAHNSHLGDASATEMGELGEHNIGQLCRGELGSKSYLIGFGTHSGTVMAASEWDGEPELKEVIPALNGSYEDYFHSCGIRNFTMPLRHPISELPALVCGFQLERAIGVIYLPESERFSHYFRANLSNQFDEYIWMDVTHAVRPLPARIAEEIPETFPFGV